MNEQYCKICEFAKVLSTAFFLRSYLDIGSSPALLEPGGCGSQQPDSDMMRNQHFKYNSRKAECVTRRQCAGPQSFLRTLQFKTTKRSPHHKSDLERSLLSCWISLN